MGPILREISAARMKADVEKLVSFGTRHTLSDTASPTRGVGAARTWIHDELDRIAHDTASGGRSGKDLLQVSFDTPTQPKDGKRVARDVEIVNVMAVLPGAMPEAAARRYYVVAHYDSRASDPTDATSDAPGANDDASGVAVVIELARVLSKHRFDATIVFLATAGEEQGLLGAKLHARAARDAKLDIRAVLNNDIVGDPGASTSAIRAFSEGLAQAATNAAVDEVRKLGSESDSPSRELARFVAFSARDERTAITPTLVFRRDRFLRGGDHLAFAELGFPAVRFTTVDEHYERQHQNVRAEGGVRYGDVAEFVNADYLADVARLNAATLVHLANAPAPPADARIVTATLGNDVVLRWSASPEPDLLGYEVVWRDTTAADWQAAKDAGTTTEARLAMNKDNYFFGVRARDKNGYASTISFAGAAAE